MELVSQIDVLYLYNYESGKFVIATHLKRFYSTVSYSLYYLIRFWHICRSTILILNIFNYTRVKIIKSWY